MGVSSKTNDIVTFLKPNLDTKVQCDTLALRGVIKGVLVSCIGIDEGIFSYLVIHPSPTSRLVLAYFSLMDVLLVEMAFGSLKSHATH